MEHGAVCSVLFSSHRGEAAELHAPATLPLRSAQPAQKRRDRVQGSQASLLAFACRGGEMRFIQRVSLLERL